MVFFLQRTYAKRKQNKIFSFCCEEKTRYSHSTVGNKKTDRDAYKKLVLFLLRKHLLSFLKFATIAFVNSPRSTEPLPFPSVIGIVVKRTLFDPASLPSTSISSNTCWSFPLRSLDIGLLSISLLQFASPLSNSYHRQKEKTLSNSNQQNHNHGPTNKN